MKSKWIARFKNPSFWVSVIIAIITPVLAYMGLTAQDFTTWGAVWDVIKGAASNPYVLLMAAVSVYNAIIDPTSKSITNDTKAISDNKSGEEVKK